MQDHTDDNADASAAGKTDCSTNKPEPHRPPMPRFTWRLTYAYQEDNIRLLSALRVQMVAPGSTGAAPTQGQTGNWLEVRGAQDELLHHRALPELIQHDREVFTNEPGRSMHRVPVKRVQGEFEVLVPEMPGGESITVHGHPPGTRRTDAAKVLARTSFKELMREPTTLR